MMEVKISSVELENLLVFEGFNEIFPDGEYSRYKNSLPLSMFKVWQVLSSKQFYIYLFIYSILRNFTPNSLFNSNELLSMRVLPSLRNTYKGAYGISSD